MLQRFDFADQLGLAKAENNTRQCEAEFIVDLASLDRLGAPSWEDDPQTWTEGIPPSPSRGWRLVAHCGLEFVVFQEWMPGGLLGVDHAVVMVGALDEVDHALMHLPFKAAVNERFGSKFEGGWEVRRIDDLGNCFSVGRYPREASARCAALRCVALRCVALRCVALRRFSKSGRTSRPTSSTNSVRLRES